MQVHVCFRWQVDPFHTLFGLAGLALLGSSEVKPVNPVYCLPEETIERLQIRPELLGWVLLTLLPVHDQIRQETRTSERFATNCSRNLRGKLNAHLAGFRTSALCAKSSQQRKLQTNEWMHDRITLLKCPANSFLLDIFITAVRLEKG